MSNHFIAPGAVSTPPSDAALWAITQGALHLPALVAATRLGFFEALAERAMTPERLASRLGVTPRAAQTLLAWLTTLGFITLDQQGAALTPLARTYLLPSSPFFWGGMLRRLSSLSLDAEALERACKAGPTVYGDADLWQVHEREPELAEQFAEAAHARAIYAATELARLPLFSSIRRLLDVAGGQGTYAVALAEANPSLQVTLLDLAPVCALATRYIAKAGLTQRVDVQPLNIFESAWPAPVDAVWLSDVLHDWSPASCARLLRRAYECLTPGGSLLLNEVLLDDAGGGPLAATSYGLAMILSTREGRQYSFRELAEQLTAAGFEKPTVVGKAGVHTLLRASR